MNSPSSLPLCGLPRRLLAIGYDLLLLFAVLFAATAIWLPFTGGNAIPSGNSLYLLYLSGCAYLYFSWQWRHGGQTLGMRAWRIRLLDVGGRPVSWRGASLRFVLAILSWLPAGAGFIWAIFEADGLAFHDRYSGTRLVKT